MNERIEELAGQCEGRTICECGEVGFKYEKFAELIVKECIKEIGYKSVELLDIDFYPHYQERLKKYFGVEE